ncbi:MAG: hypothetical protein V4507_15525 [Verrucomicrobiota bacterium]
MKTTLENSIDSEIIIHIKYDAPDSHRIYLDENHAMTLQNFLRNKHIQSSIEYHVLPDPMNDNHLQNQFCLKIPKTQDRSILFSLVTDYLTENNIPFERDDHSNSFVLFPQ